MTPRRRRPRALFPAGILLTATLATGVMLGGAAPASAHSSPSAVPNPFQDYSAQDYADALWNLETEVFVRTHEREEHGDCDTVTYEVSHPLGSEPTRTFAHVADPENWWCFGEQGDELRAELEEQDEASEHFFHGRPYENVTQRVPYYGTWADVNGNGVTSRVEIHARDLGNSTFTVSGTYWDHYSGQRVNIGSTETHGEHMIPVGHTWPEMQHRSRKARVAYYNDPMNLTSTIGWINREKAGQTPSEWMPSNEEAWCAYAMTWTHISAKHEISQYASDIDHLRGVLWDCLEEQLEGHDDATLPEGRSGDLDWASLPPSSYPLAATEQVAPREAEGEDHYTQALRRLEREVPVRSVERESRGDCDVQTFTTQHPSNGRTATYARVISEDNGYCAGSEAEELRAELDERAEESEEFFHGSPLAGRSRDYFGYWTDMDGDGVNTRNEVLARDLHEVEWNSTETGVVSGAFHDPYTGEFIRFSPERAALDHIIPVPHAWIEMEHREPGEREAFYNDAGNLLAVSDAARQEKAADAPRNWMPEHEGFRCRYAVAWAETAAAHEISLYASDIAVLRETLYRCLTEEG
ncbi:hypothetical protein [Nesterenkonia flava]|uniref:DUF1524 domain-containing protein n=1 Tax=Nesterenkonia flava TaxID=469799 RepID=A0ABU1FRF0_9MICC|nr:hypothetical protein [Nesterenkonia flava]MDR5710763.1 hypothetical protein [Nesterenkonia flava]